MELPNAGKIIYFYVPSIPWRTVSHNQRVSPRLGDLQIWIERSHLPWFANLRDFRGSPQVIKYIIWDIDGLPIQNGDFFMGSHGIYHPVMTNSLPWKDPPIFKNGKPSISMCHLYHGYVSGNQRVDMFIVVHLFPLTKHTSFHHATGFRRDLRRDNFRRLGRDQNGSWVSAVAI